MQIAMGMRRRGFTDVPILDAIKAMLIISR
jgi:hypothetical protein